MWGAFEMKQRKSEAFSEEKTCFFFSSRPAKLLSGGCFFWADMRKFLQTILRDRDHGKLIYTFDDTSCVIRILAFGETAKPFTEMAKSFQLLGAHCAVMSCLSRIMRLFDLTQTK